MKKMDFKTLNLQYPIGTFEESDYYGNQKIFEMISEIEKFPLKLKEIVSSLSEEELNIPYREKGWNSKQVVHHLADSHLNAYLRFKLALTENNPTIRPYLEDKFGELEEYNTTPIKLSLEFIDVLHQKWIILLNTLSENDLEKTYFHPELNENVSLKTAVKMYAWHSEHHFQHIVLVKNEKQSFSKF
ncbi:MAG: putative metal-dependent hydrolase [Flavobacteriales bacterium]|nr:putative metal-dependent hydrolase [Flavobacteriales bacterium]